MSCESSRGYSAYSSSIISGETLLVFLSIRMFLDNLSGLNIITKDLIDRSILRYYELKEI